MGANIHPPHHPNHPDLMLSPNPSQHRIHLPSPYHSRQYSNTAQLNFVDYMSKDFTFTQDSLAVLSRQEIVENNFSQEFDPLFTTFRPQNKKTYGKFRILCSNITNEKIQEYKLFFRNQHDFRTFLMSYFWRKSHPEHKNWPLVRTTNLKIYEESKSVVQGGISGLIRRNCSSSRQIYCRVYIEEIPLRLCHIKDIPFPENLYVLQQVLRGFEIIYESIGYIKPLEDLICITRKGTIKVWINSDLSKNFPNVENIDENQSGNKSESRLINQLIEMVGKNTDGNGLSVSFLGFMKEQHINMQFITFEKVLEMIRMFQREYNITIPSVFSSILQVLNQQEEEYDTYRTEMQHGNEEKQSSQRVQNSGSGLFLEAANSSSRRRFHHKQKSKLSSKKQSSRRVQAKHMNKTNKTQSLKIHQDEQNSLLQSMAGAKSNMMLSQSQPLQRSINPQPSSNQMNGSGVQTKQITRQDQNWQINKFNQAMNKFNQADFIAIQREHEEKSSDSVMAIRESNQRPVECVQWMGRETAEGMNVIGNVAKQQGTHQVNARLDSSIKVHKHRQHNSSHSHLALNSPNFSQNALPLQSHSHHTLLNHSLKFHSKHQLPHNKSQNLPQLLKNKKTYSHLYVQKDQDEKAVLDDDIWMEQNLNDAMVICVEATEEEVKQIIEIDKFIEAQVQKEEEQRLRLSQMYQQDPKAMGKSQQLMDSSQFNTSHNHLNASKHQVNSSVNHLEASEHQVNFTKHQINSSKHQLDSILHRLNNSQHPMNKNRKGLNFSQHNAFNTNQQPFVNQPHAPSTMTIPPALNRNSSSHMSSHQMSSHREEFSGQQMQSSRQKPQTIDSGLYNNMHSFHYVSHLHPQETNLILVNSSIVDRPNHLPKGEANIQHPADEYQSDLFPTQHHLQPTQNPDSNPISKTSFNPHPLSFPQFNTHIQIQPPSSSSRAHTLSSNFIRNPLENHHTDKHLPQIVISTSSNQVLLPISQYHILLPSNHRHQNPQSLISSTSIGHSIMAPTSNQIHFHANQTIVSSPLNAPQRRPKVTFNSATPQKISYVQLASSKTASMNHSNFSQHEQTQQPHQTLCPLTLSNPGENPRDINYNRLSYRAQTMVSAYVPSQGYNSSSRKYFDHEESSSYSKPSIVEYSYLKNPEYFVNAHHELNHAGRESQQILERSMENSLPALSAEFIAQHQASQKHLPKSSRSQLNHQYAYHVGPYEPQIMGIVPIPEDVHAETFNNSRSLVNNDEYFGDSNSMARDHFKENNDNLTQQIVMVSSRHEQIISPYHKALPSGIKAADSEKQRQQQSKNNPQITQTHHDQSSHRKKSYFISEDFSHCAEDPIRSQSSNRNVEFKINIRPSFESMSGCSQLQEQAVGNKSHIVYKKKQNCSSFLSGQQKQAEHQLMVGQRGSEQGSHGNEKSKSGYRVVESVEENRAVSTYQMRMDEMGDEGRLKLKIEEGSSMKGKNASRQANVNSASMFNKKKGSDQKKRLQQLQSGEESQKWTPRRMLQKPVTGRTMFMNKENELLSEFIDMQSELESEVDYTYNSYDKWKDKSKVLDFGPSRFREFEDRVEWEGDEGRKWNNVAFNYPERHGNHKQLVKSSIEGSTLVEHEFARGQFNTVQKDAGLDQGHQLNRDSNQMYFESFSPDNPIEIGRFRKTSEYKVQEIDEDIFNDLRQT